MKPVTVIVPTRNRPELLRRALRSIEAQLPVDDEHPIGEVIVVFDQSEPDPMLSEEFPSLDLKLVKNDRTPGLAGARNTGIVTASCDWVAFCDDDDWWALTKLRNQAAAIEARPDADFIVGNITIRIGDRSIDRAAQHEMITFADLLRDRVMEAHPSTFLVRYAAIDEYLGLVDEDLPGGYAEDYDFLLRAAREKPIVVTPTPCAYVQWHEKSFFGSRWQMIDEALEYLVAKTPEFQTDRRGLARIEGQRGFAKAAMGQRSDALRAIRRTIRLDWRQPRAYLALPVAGGLVSADRLVRWANRLGRGI